MRFEPKVSLKRYKNYTSNVQTFLGKQRSSAVERWAHNPEVEGSKPSVAITFIYTCK
jgi:hypothetical protein